MVKKRSVMNNKKMMEAYEAVASDFTQSSQKINDLFSELRSKYNVPNLLINKLIVLYENYHEYENMMTVLRVSKESSRL
jgi:CRISPR/Cas system-associated endonuclease Cas3-HD